MGIMAGILAFKGHMPHQLRLFAMTGFLGGFTTFSAFSLEVVLMIEPSQYFSAAFYGLISIVLSVMAAFFGVNFIGLLYQ
jgi:CrcB protein